MNRPTCLSTDYFKEGIVFTLKQMVQTVVQITEKQSLLGLDSLKIQILTTLKVEIFAGTNFRDFSTFSVVRESLYPRNRIVQVIRENLYPRNFSHFLTREIF